MGQKLHLYLWNGHCVQNSPFPPKEQIYDWTGLFGVLLLGLFLEVIIVENITFFLDFFFTVPSNSPISGLPQNNYISLRWPWKDSPMGNAKLQNWFSVVLVASASKNEQRMGPIFCTHRLLPQLFCGHNYSLSCTAKSCFTTEDIISLT